MADPDQLSKPQQREPLPGPGVTDDPNASQLAEVAREAAVAFQRGDWAGAELR